MANELKHGSVGTELTQAEWEAVGAHVFANQAAGDILYAISTSQLSRLGKQADNTVLHLASGIPEWSATLAGLTLTTPTISSTGFANATHAHAASNSGGALTYLGTIATGVWQGTDVGVAYGGTGVSTLAANSLLTGNGTSAIVAEASLTFDGTDLILADSKTLALGTGGDSQIYYDGTDTFWNLRDTGTGDLMIALAGSYPSPDAGRVHIWEGSAGSVDSNAVTQLTIEHSDDAGIQFLTPADKVNYILFGDAVANNAGFINYTHSSDKMGLKATGGVDLLSNAAGLINVGASGNDWTANLFVLQNANSGAGNMIKVGNTSADAASSAVVYVVSDGTSAGDAYGRFRAGTHETVWGMDNSADLGAIGQNATLGANDVLRFTIATPPVATYNAAHPTGVFDYVCETCQEHSGTPFNCHGVEAVWHDDVAALAPILQWADNPENPELLRHMADLGIFDLKQSGNEIVPWVGLAPVKAHLFTWSAMRQMYRKIEGLESELKALKAA